MLPVWLEIIGREPLFEAFDRLARSATDARPWDKNKRLRFERQSRHMDTRGSGRWEPLKPATLARKLHDPQASFQEILQRTGGLYFSVTREGAAFNVTREGPGEFEEGTSHPLAVLHHQGRGKVPEREVLHVEEDEINEHFSLFVGRKEAEARLAGFEVLRG